MISKRIVGVTWVLVLAFNGLMGQDRTLSVAGIVDQYEQQPDAPAKFNFFYETANRYEYESAYDWLDAVNEDLNRSIRQGDSTAMRTFQLIQAQLYFDVGDYNKSIALARDLYSQDPNADDAVFKNTLELIDKNYGELQLYDKQIDIRKEKRERGYTDNIAFYDIYSNLGMHRKALSDYIEDNKSRVDQNSFFEMAEYDNKVGMFLLKDKSAAAALSYFKKAQGFISIYLNDINIAKTVRELKAAQLLNGIIDGNIGKAHVLLMQYNEALPFLETSISIIEDNHQAAYQEELVENTLALAEALIELDNLAKALEYLKPEPGRVPVELVLKRNRLLSSYYSQVGDHASESYYLRRNLRIADSIDQVQTSRWKQQLLSVVANEELADTKLRYDEQKRELERGRAELQAQDMRINLVFISLVFTLLGFAGLVYAYLKSIKNQRLIAEQKHIIENALLEKDSLLKEIHHRVKNNLQMVSSLLSLQTKNTRSRAAIEALEEGKTRVKAMALIHQKLYQNDDLSVIEMQEYIESLINSVQSVFKKGGHHINITIDAEGVELDIDRAIPIGLILNELVSNSFKYAFPDDDENGKIYILISKTGDGGFFEYTDNGVGLPDDSDDRAENSMGIRLIRRLVNQLQSNLNIDKKEEGVRFWFNFK